MINITLKNIILALFAALVIAFLVYWFEPVFASTNDGFTICHHTPGNTITLHFNTFQGYLGHLGTPHSGQTFDTNGTCPSPSPSPSVLPSASPSIEPSPSPSVEPSPSIEPECEKECEPEPSPSPSREPEPTPFPQTDGLTAPGPAQPPEPKACANIEFAPTLLSFNRLSPTEVKITWTKTDPIDDYRVFYGLSEDNLQWSVGVENTHEVILGNLSPNLSIWVQVKGTDGLCLGQGSLVVDP